jgi:hypothetical protein
VEKAALRCEIGSVHQILGCDVKLTAMKSRIAKSQARCASV